MTQMEPENDAEGSLDARVDRAHESAARRDGEPHALARLEAEALNREGIEIANAQTGATRYRAGGGDSRGQGPEGERDDPDRAHGAIVPGRGRSQLQRRPE